MKTIKSLRFLTGAAMTIGLTVALSSCVRKGFDAPPDNSSYDPMLPVTHTIAQLKNMVGAYTSSTSYDDTTFAGDIVVSGIVTADDRSGNFYKQIVIQDATGGIAVNINNYSLYTHYPVGRKLYIKCKGMTLSYDGGTPVLGLGLTEQRAVKGLESSDIDAHIIRANTGNAVKDTVISLATAKLADPFFINRLVTIADVEFLDTTRTYTSPEATTNRYLVNCAATSTSQQLTTRNSNYASFHGLKVPAGHGSISGILTVFVSSSRIAQVLIRDTSDVKMQEPRCTGAVTPPPSGTLLYEPFTGGTSNAEVAITGWTNYSETGSVKWKYGTGGTATNKPYAQISAYKSAQPDVKTWLVTTAVNLAGASAPKLSFLNTDGFDNGATLTVLVSTNYTAGSNPSTATWTTLSPAISTGHANSYGSFISSGTVSLSSYIGQTVHIAFKYTGSDAATPKTTTYEIDNVTVTKD